MFSFHKPKVYRSTQGCCICKAKSSSSRFTDSKKYELDFIECFQLDVPRQGEICNACVLLVKRFKRLPPDSDRNWGHVVDARVGPGLKSMTKFKKRKEEQQQQQQIAQQQQQQTQQQPGGSASVSACGEKFGKIFKKTKTAKLAVAESGACSPSHGSSDDVASPIHLSDTDIEFANAKDPVANLYCHEQLTDDMHITCAPTSIPLTSTTTTSTTNNTTSMYPATATHVTINCNSVPTSAAPVASVARHSASPALRRRARKSTLPVRNRQRLRHDANVLAASDCWSPVNTCCGLVYEHRLIDAVLLDAAHWRRDHCVHHGQRDVEVGRVPSVEQGNDVAPSSRTPAAAALSIAQSDGNRKSAADVSVVAATSVPTFVSSAGRKIKLTSNAVQFLRKAAGTRGQSAATATIAAPAKQATTVITVAKPSPSSSTSSSSSLLGKLITIKAGGAVGSAAAGIPIVTTDQLQLRMAGTLNETNGHKFNDNSSDSGYDEAMLNEPNAAKHAASIVRPLVLPNGIRLHVQSQKLCGMPSLSNQIVVVPINAQLASNPAALYTGAAQQKPTPTAAMLDPTSITLNGSLAATRPRRN